MKRLLIEDADILTAEYRAELVKFLDHIINHERKIFAISTSLYVAMSYPISCDTKFYSVYRKDYGRKTWDFIAEKEASANGGWKLIVN